MAKAAPAIYAENLELYKKLAATNPSVERKGASDFMGNLAVMLKRADNKKTSSRKQVERKATLAPMEVASKHYVSKH